MTHHHHEVESGNLDHRLWASAALNLGITLVELARGLWAGSLALLADAAHNLAGCRGVGSGDLRAQIGPARADRGSCDFRRYCLFGCNRRSWLMRAAPFSEDPYHQECAHREHKPRHEIGPPPGGTLRLPQYTQTVQLLVGIQNLTI